MMAVSDTKSTLVLNLSIDQMRRIVEGLTDAAIIVDKNLRPVVWNLAYIQCLGLRPRRFLKRLDDPDVRCRDLLCLEICEKECLARQVFETGKSVRMDEIIGTSKVLEENNETTTLIVSTTPLENSDGTIVAALEVYRDVTAEARIQTRYKGLLDRERRRAEILEEQVKERTADLQRSMEELRNTRAQLIQSEKLSSLGQLIAGIAHEINNPINFIYGNTDFLQSYVDAFLKIVDTYSELKLATEDQARMEDLKQELDYEYLKGDTENLLRSIRSGAERATAIIRDLRAFIHGRPNQRSPVNVVKCVNQTLNLLTHETKDRIEIVQEGTENIPDILCNEGQLNQVFMNLLVNAIQAMTNIQDRHITIRFYVQDEGVGIDVQDEGVGIAEENLLKVFDPFFTTKPVGQGTGLGLSLSYSIVDAHGGKLSVVSEVGQGSTFTVWLPKDTAHVEEQVAHAATN